MLAIVYLRQSVFFFFQLQGKEKSWSVDSFIHYIMLCESLCYHYYAHSTYLYFVYDFFFAEVILLIVKIYTQYKKY